MIKTCHNSSSRQRLCMPGAISHETPRLDASTASTIAVFQHQYLFGFPPPYRDPVYAVCHRSLKPTCVHDTLWRNRDAYSLEPQIYQLFPLVFRCLITRCLLVKWGTIAWATEFVLCRRHYQKMLLEVEGGGADERSRPVRSISHLLVELHFHIFKSWWYLGVRQSRKCKMALVARNIKNH